MPIFLPLLWLFAYYISDIGGAALGVVWIGGRVLYMVSYSEAADKRGPRLRHSGDRLRRAPYRGSDRHYFGSRARRLNGAPLRSVRRLAL